MYHPPAEYLGQRLPYYFVGLIWTLLGLLGQTFASLYELWILYATAFFVTMLGINILYAMMLAILADQVPAKQVGTANGILAFQLVVGSIFGFGLFHTLLQQDISNMYYLYSGCVLVAGLLTVAFAHERDAAFAWAERTEPPQHHISLLQSLVDPIVTPNDSPWWQSYTIDVNSDFFFVTLSRLFYYCGNSVQTFFLYFLHDIIRVQDKSGGNPEAAVAQLAMLGQLSGAAVCYPIGFFSDYIGSDRRPIVYMSCAVFSACLLCMIAATSMNNMVVLSTVLGAANGVYLTMETSLAVDTLPKSRSSSQLAELAKKEEGSNAKGSAQLLGIWGVAAFLGSALGPMVGGPLLYLFGKKNDNDDEETDEYSLRGYAVVLSLSAFYFFCSAWSLRYIRKPNGNAEV
jgi:MFS family permease